MNYKTMARPTADAAEDLPQTEARVSGFARLRAAMTRPAHKPSIPATPSARIVADQGGVYELNERQAKHFEECIATERKPGEKLLEAARRYKARVISK